jgi:hypothetical protein
MSKTSDIPETGDDLNNHPMAAVEERPDRLRIKSKDFAIQG